MPGLDSLSCWVFVLFFLTLFCCWLACVWIYMVVLLYLISMKFSISLGKKISTTHIMHRFFVGPVSGLTILQNDPNNSNFFY